MPFLRLTITGERLAETRIVYRNFIFDIADVVANRAVPRGSNFGRFNRRPRIVRMTPVLPIRFQLPKQPQITYFQLVRHSLTFLQSTSV